MRDSRDRSDHRLLIRLYEPVAAWSLRRKWLVIASACVLVVVTIPVYQTIERMRRRFSSSSARSFLASSLRYETLSGSEFGMTTPTKKKAAREVRATLPGLSRELVGAGEGAGWTPLRSREWV